MLSLELQNLVHEIILQKCERQDIELKSAGAGTPEKLYATLSGFANQSGGGIIVFGIDEKNGYAITGVYDAQDLQVNVTNQAEQMEPIVRPVFTTTVIDGKTIVSAEISECNIFDKPCFYKGKGRMKGSFIRVGEADMPMTEYEVYSYEVFKRKIQDELRIVERADQGDFNKDELTQYFINLRKLKPNLARLQEAKIMKLQGLSDNEKPTVAGIMLFGEYPQAFFPQLSVIAMVIAGTELGEIGADGERFLDNQRIEGTIPQMLEASLAFISRNTRNATIIDENGNRMDRTEYPMVAVREIILNALIHRDYSIHTDQSPIRIMLFQDRLEVDNPGGLYGRITIDNLGKSAADTRNPFIAGAMEVMQKTENRFSGIPTIRRELQTAGLPPAVFEDIRGSFKVTIYNKAEKDNELSSSDLIDSILQFCESPRTRDEIAAFLNMKTPSYVIKRYIEPMILTGKLELTLPDTPRSKNQRYITKK